MVVVTLASNMQIPSKDCGDWFEELFVCFVLFCCLFVCLFVWLFVCLFVCLCFNQQTKDLQGCLVPTWFGSVDMRV